MSETSAAAKRRLRRIPEEFRKRNAQSCDRCRKRRCKCVPSPSGNGCVPCQQHNIHCSYTAPRKTRFYGSVDELSDRYRCLDAIVKAAFPTDETSTAAELVQLGRRLGYDMPDLADSASSPVKLEELIRAPTDSAPQPSAASPSGSSVGSRSKRYRDDKKHPLSDQSSEPATRFLSQVSSEESHLSLIRDTSGNEHYIGPSGTLNFLSQLRRLVDADLGGSVTITAADSVGAQKFTCDDTAQALEASDDHHDKETSDEQAPPNISGMSIDNNTPVTSPQSGPSPGSVTSALARDFTRLPSASIDEILGQFPPDGTLEMLIHSYFKNVHDDFPLFHRATFEEEYELFVVQSRRQSISSTDSAMKHRQRMLPDWGWVGCLHMILVFGSISDPNIPGIDHAALRRNSVTATRTLLPQFISKCTLTNVRVLLLLSLFLHNNNERNAAWNLVGTATRICFALGLHRPNMMSSFRPLEREVRKSVFCTLYSFDQFLASSLGRPSGLHEMDVEVVPPREGFLDGNSGTDAQLVSLSVKLQGILSKTRLMHIGKLHNNDGSSSAFPPGVDEVLGALDDWKAEIGKLPGFDLPWIKTGSSSLDRPSPMDLEHLRVSLSWRTRSQLRSVLLIHMQFHFIAIVATRPLLLRDVANLRKGEALPQFEKMALSEQAEACVRNACQLVYIPILLDSFDIINGLTGLDIFYAYCAAMVLILRLLRPLPRVSGIDTQQADVQEQNTIRSLVTKVQDVIKRAAKGGSMKRFAIVVDTFFDVINKPVPRGMDRHITTTVQQPPHQQLQHPNPQYYQPQQPQHGGPVTGYMYDPSLSPEQALAQTPQFSHPGRGDAWLGYAPLSTFGGLGANEGMFPQFVNSDETNTVGWSDMDILLGGGMVG